MTSIEVKEVPVDEAPAVKIDKRKTRTPKQIEALTIAREKAMEMRKSNAEITRKSRELKKSQRDEKKKEVERLYDEMMEKKNRPPTPEPEPPKPKPKPEPEPELKHEPKPEPEPEPESDEEVDERIINKYLAKKNVSKKSLINVVPNRPPPAYRSAFEGNFYM